MRSSSSRLRLGGALVATSLSILVGLGGTAFADSGQGEEHRNDRAGSRNDETVGVTEDTDTNDGATPNNVVDAGDDAHPSGNDRSVENGGSANQGNATSEPDGNGSGPERDNGGVDQPGEPGGVDLADQDGNNGCGNDDDFEDDNEGLCGKPAKASPSNPPAEEESGEITPAIVPSSPVQNETKVEPAQVLGVTVERPATVASSTPAVEAVAASPVAVAAPASAVEAAPATVLGATVVRGAALARTGFGTTPLMVVAITLLLVGFTLVRRPKGAHFMAS